MGFALTDAPERTLSAETLTIVESVEHTRKVKGGEPITKRLAVARTGNDDHVLVREHERGLYADGATEPRDDDDKRSRENGTEPYWKRTSRIADIADAVASGLLTA